MGVERFINGYSNDDIETVTEAIFYGELPVDQENELRNVLKGLSRDDLRRIVSAREEARGLLEVLGIEVPVEEVRTLSEDEQAAIADVRHLLERRGGRGVDYYNSLADALRSGDASKFAGVTQDTLDEIPDADRRDLADDAEAAATEIAGEQMDASDFPDVEDATTRAQGRTIADYWRPLKEEFESNGPYTILEEEGVSDSQLRKLKQAEDAREEFIDRIDDAIAGIKRSRGERPSRTETSTREERGRREERRPSPERPEQGLGGIPARAYQIVPPRERMNPRTGEEWTASEQQYERELHFMAFVLKVKPNRSRWSSAEFMYPPGDRDTTMEQWTRLQTANNPAAREAARKAGLPESWLG